MGGMGPGSSPVSSHVCGGGGGVELTYLNTFLCYSIVTLDTLISNMNNNKNLFSIVLLSFFLNSNHKKGGGGALIFFIRQYLYILSSTSTSL